MSLERIPDADLAVHVADRREGDVVGRLQQCQFGGRLEQAAGAHELICGNDVAFVARPRASPGRG